MSSELDIPVKDTKKKGSILYKGSIMKIHDKGNKRTDKRNCIVSEFDIRYYKKNRPDRQFFWSALVAAEYLSEQGEFDFVFNNSKKFDEATNELCRFLPQDADELADLIGKFLYRYLGANEYTEQIKIDTFTKDKIVNNCRAILSRFKSSLAGKFAVIDEYRSAVDFLAENVCVRSNNIVIDPKNEKLIKYLAYALYALITYPFADSIVIPPTEGTDVSKLLAGLRSKTFPFKHISYGETPTVNFAAFWENLAEFHFDNLVSLGLINFDMNNDHLESVVKGAVAKKLTSLGFIGAGYLNEEFYTKIFTPEFDSLLYFNITQARNVDLKLLFQHAKQLKHINLASIGIEIADILTELQQADLPNLVSINIGSNPASKPLENIKLPDTLVRLDASFVQFSNNVLTQLFEIIHKSKVTSLYLTCVALQPDDLTYLTDTISKLSFKLQRFSWSGNEVDANFFIFLSKCKSLRYLMMNRVFTPTRSYLINDFVNALKNLTKLKKVYLAGLKEQMTGPAFIPILQQLKELKYLEVLDVSTQAFGNEGFNILIDMVKESQIKELGFDDCKIDNPDLLTQIADAAQARNSNINLAYCEETVFDLMDNHGAVGDLEDTIIYKFNKALYPDTPEYNKDDPMTRPFDYNVIYVYDVYPEYRNEYLIEETENGHPGELGSSDESSADGPPPKKSRRQQETESDSSDEPPPQKKSKRQPETESESSDEPPPPPKQKKQVLPETDSSDEPPPPPKKKPVIPSTDSEEESEPLKKKQLESESESSDEPLPPPKKFKKQPEPESESSDEPLPPPKKKPQPESESSDEPLPPPKKSKKQPEPESSEEPLPPPKKPKKQPEPESESYSEPPPPKKSKKEPEPESESSDEPPPPPKKAKKQPEPESESESEDEHPKKPSKKPRLDSDDLPPPKKSETEEDSDEEEKKPLPKKQRKPDVAKPSPKKNKYEEPNWEPPAQIRKPYDNKKSQKALQKQFDMNTLLNKITNDK